MVTKIPPSTVWMYKKNAEIRKQKTKLLATLWNTNNQQINEWKANKKNLLMTVKTATSCCCFGQE